MPRSHPVITPARALTRLCLAFAFAWPAFALADTARFEIQAEPLPAALKAFAQQAHMQLLYEYTIVQDLKGNSVIGTIEKHTALEALLRDTGLEVVFTSANAATIRPIRAQTPNDAPKSSAKNSDRKGTAGRDPTPRSSVDTLQVIVVTAQRRKEDENSVPVAIAAFTGATLREQNINTVSDLQNLVPSLTAIGQSDRDDCSVSIRGMGPTAGGGLAPGGGNGVVSYFADVPIINAGGPGLFYDLENVQVLNGPQGTLFGKNTTGGAVLFVPNRPTDKLEGNLEVDGGDYGMRGLTGVVNIPIVDDKVLLRVAAKAYQEDGFTTDRGPDFPGKKYDNESYWTGRVSLLVRPTENFENYTIFSYLRDKDNGDGFVLAAVNPAGSYASLLIPYFAQQEAAGIRSTSFDTNTVNDREKSGIFNTSTWTISDDVQFKNIASYQDSKWRNAEDLDASPFALFDNIGPTTGYWHETTAQITEEMQLQGAALNHDLKWTVGGYYEHDYATGPQPYLSVYDNFEIVTNKAASPANDRAGYGQLTYDLGGIYSALQGVKITAGYRYTWDHYGFAVSTYSPTFGNICFSGPGVYPNCLYEDDAGKSSGESWTLGISDQIDENNLIYIRSARGYIPGSFNANLGYTPGFGASSAQFNVLPESDVDIELGLKSRFTIAGMRAGIDTDIFRTDFTNIQRSVVENIVNNVGITQPEGFLANASEAVIQGFELQGTILPTPNLQLGLTYSYNDGKYTKIDPLAAPSLVGIPFAQLPKHKIDLSGTYTLPLDPGVGVVDISANCYCYQSSYFDGSSVEPYAYIPSYGLLNVRLDWKGIYDSSWDASVFMTNATNKDYVVSQFGGYHEDGYVARLYGAARMFGVQFRYSFGK